MDHHQDNENVVPLIKANSPTTKKPKLSKYALGCAILASITSLVQGYSVSVISGASIFIKDDLHLDDTQIEVISGIIMLYSAVGSVVTGRISDLIGRRFAMALASVFFCVGALLVGVASNYGVLMASRFFGGIGAGFSLTIAPVYTTEVAPASSRGLLSSLPEILMNTGVLLGFVSNYAFSGLDIHLGWRLMFYVGAAPPLFLAVAVLFMPESPRWLVMKGHVERAEAVLSKTSDTAEEAELRLAEIKEAAHEAASAGGVWRKLLLHSTPSIRRIVSSAILLQFFQQASGIDSVVLYSPRIFEKAGFTSNADQLALTVAVGVIKVVFILVTTFLSDRAGRRPLLLASAGGVCISLLSIAVSLWAIDGELHSSPWIATTSVTFVLLFVAFFSMGFGPLAWVYCSEIFPLWLRGQGAGLGVASNRLSSAIVGMTFLSLCEAITIYGAFLLYAVIAAVSFVFIYFCLPETRGRGLEEIEELFGGRKHNDKIYDA